ncbi:MAG: hypothetical protein KAX49_11830 [Halanaerobiales bacterium]|nr:hypothetical protein [Halanaerobiales bacterium]
MKIVFDLDGVLRDLTGTLVRECNVPYPQTWYWRYDSKKMQDYIKGDFTLLSRASPTEYLDVIKKYFNTIEIWSNQLKDWIEPTHQWLDKYIPSYELYILNSKGKYKRLSSEPNTILVEDYPNFPNYDKIILIDRLYNRKTEAIWKIKYPRELDMLLCYLTSLNRKER